MATMNGTIKRLVSDKGFGFILASDGNEYFFHNSACADTRFDDNLIYRLAKAAECGQRVSLKTDTVAQIVRLGAAERGVKDETAFARIFRIRDPAEDRVLTGAVAA